MSSAHDTSVRLSRTYVVRARGDQWRTHTRCRLPISVGQKYHEGEKFLATVDWVNRHSRRPHENATDRPFDQCTIVLADTLHRHNLPHLPPDQAWAQAHADGEAWLLRNAAALNSFTVPVQVVRWADLVESAPYTLLRERLTRLSSAPHFAAALDRAVTAWSSRRGNAHTEPDLDHRQRCREYILEEIAGVAVLESIAPAALCYPGSMAFFATARAIAFAYFARTVSDIPAGLVAFTETQLHIRRRRAGHNLIRSAHSATPPAAQTTAPATSRS